MKSDFFGIGPAIRAALGIYRTAARDSGRTTRLLQALQSGDRVICQNIAAMRDMQRLLRERGFERDAVQVRILPAEDHYRLVELERIQGRTYFDHAWVETYYQVHFDRAESEFARIDEHFSTAPVDEGAPPTFRS